MDLGVTSDLGYILVYLREKKKSINWVYDKGFGPEDNIDS